MKNFIIVTFIISLVQPAFADQLALSYNQGYFAMIVGLANDGKENELKSAGFNYGRQFDASYLLGEEFGVLMGISHGKVYESFSFKPTGLDKEFFESDYNYRGLKLGGWKLVDGKNLVQINFVYAKGEFHFFGKDPAVVGRNIPASMLEMEVRGLVSFYEIQKVQLDFLGGLKVFKIFIPELNYNGRTHESHEDHNDSNFQITVGLGIRNIMSAILF